MERVQQEKSMLPEPLKTPEERFNAEAIHLVEKLVDDFARLLVRYGKSIEVRSEQETGEIAAQISVLLEDFYEPVDHSNDLTDEEYESLNQRLGFDVRNQEQLLQWWQGHIDAEREKIRRLDGQL
jgi:hypothetical protein